MLGLADTALPQDYLRDASPRAHSHMVYLTIF